jgi:AP-1-like transcription factor
VEDLEKASETTNQENGLLRAQVERLQVELKEYRKRLSWISNSGPGASSSLGSSAPGAAARNSLNSNQNDFRFDFPRFGDLPANQLLNNSDSNNKANNHPSRSSTLPSNPSNFGVPGVVERNLMSSSSPTLPPPSYGSTGNSPMNAASISPPARTNQNSASNSSFDGFSGLFSPSILEASRQASSGYFPQRNIATSATPTSLQTSENKIPNSNVRQQSTSSLSNTDSPNSSYESHQNGSSIGSSIGTSPEPSFNSPGPKGTDYVLLTISEENQPQNNFAGKPPFARKSSFPANTRRNPFPA